MSWEIAVVSAVSKLLLSVMMMFTTVLAKDLTIRGTKISWIFSEAAKKGECAAMSFSPLRAVRSEHFEADQKLKCQLAGVEICFINEAISTNHSRNLAMGRSKASKHAPIPVNI